MASFQVAESLGYANVGLCRKAFQLKARSLPLLNWGSARHVVARPWARSSRLESRDSGLMRSSEHISGSVTPMAARPLKM